MNAILVSVDYSDYLSLTLPYNRHHFDRVVVVTSPQDRETVNLAYDNDCYAFTTTAFYEDGAVFNKWKALEYGLDFLGREGVICIMDADILWPKEAQLVTCSGFLYTPFRRMLTEPIRKVPDESEWPNFPLHRQQREYAGYTQVFHADDPVLGDPPWHETNWKHAGGADSFFQARWPESKKIRPKFEVLHLGESGVNWCGRASAYLDGTVPDDRAEKIKQVRNFIRGRTTGPNRFDGEKIT